MRIGPADIAFDAEDPFSELVVVPNFTTAQKTGKARVGRRQRTFVTI